MYGDRFSRVASIRGMTIHTNVEATAIILATAFAGRSIGEAALIVGSFAVGTGLHLSCHLIVAAVFGKGIDRMILTRSGRIDYSGAPPGFAENIARTAAGPTMNALCALVSFALLATHDVRTWPPVAALALQTFATCSLVLAAINFLPAVPLDGGLMLRALLERILGTRRAASIALKVSMASMLAMAIVGVVLRQPVLVYVSIAMGYDNWQIHLRSTARAPA